MVQIIDLWEKGKNSLWIDWVHAEMSNRFIKSAELTVEGFHDLYVQTPLPEGFVFLENLNGCDFVVRSVDWGRRDDYTNGKEIMRFTDVRLVRFEIPQVTIRYPEDNLSLDIIANFQFQKLLHPG